VAQSVWWISLIIGLQERLVIYIDNLKIGSIIGMQKIPVPSQEFQENSKLSTTLGHMHPDRTSWFHDSAVRTRSVESDQSSSTEDDIQDRILHELEAFLEQSKSERKKIARRSLQTSKRLLKGIGKLKEVKKTYQTQTDRIEKSELDRRKAAGECQHCAWPKDKKGSHKTLDCFNWKQLDKGTAPFPKQRNN
jgi:hypothetical protein